MLRECCTNAIVAEAVACVRVYCERSVACALWRAPLRVPLRVLWRMLWRVLRERSVTDAPQCPL